MRISVQLLSQNDFSTEAYAVGVFNGQGLENELFFLSPDLASAVSAELKRREFQGKEGESCVLPLFQNKQVKHLIFIGLGKKRLLESQSVRSFTARAIKAANGVQAGELSFDPGLMDDLEDFSAGLQAAAEGLELAAYHFSVYKKRTAKEAVKKYKVESAVFYTRDKKNTLKSQKVLEWAKVYSEAVFLGRDLVNTPSMHMHPAEMVKVAQSLAVRGSGISCKVFDKEAMAKLGMHASLAVGQGSVHEPKFVHLIYKPKISRKAKKLVLVGKAVTFDSGGLSIKPADGMIDMKIDMAGAASVLGVFKALAKIKPKAEVHGLFAAVENIPSGSAYRPGDVVAAMDGTTIEVENTDAEGRITLADALAYGTQKIKPDYMIDLATLTGAVIIALGSDITGMFCSNQDLKNKLQQASDAAGELMWELPLHAPYRELIKSKIADVKNVGGRPAGTITAALFLEKFVGQTPWAHLDIAGPSYAEKENKPELPVGGTGWGIRTLLHLIRGL
ncbi:MAG TPA: leucyl aminopeptidase [bacterium]|nr:MAG: Cytosol aminopeptidase [Parcubacteria group bacterium ADurb.Bin192]HPN15243.1 leucyl aminopeptidase [bacterium]